MSARDFVTQAMVDAYLGATRPKWRESLGWFQQEKRVVMGIGALPEMPLSDRLALARALVPEMAVEPGWQDIADAPRDRPVEVYAPSPDPTKWHESMHDLPPIVCLTQWHPDAGFCVCTIREVTHWREHVPPAPPAQEPMT